MNAPIRQFGTGPAARWLLMAALTLWLAPDKVCWGQKVSNWRVYKMADGLPESACAAISISPHGRVLARHFNQPFITVLDGYTLQTLPAPEGGRSRVYESPGGQLWSVAPEGLQEFRQGAWLLHRVPEITAGSLGSAARMIDPAPLCPVRQGLVICLLPERLVQFNVEDPAHRMTVLRPAGQTQLESFSGLTAARDGGLWIAGARGLAKVPGPPRALKPETAWREYLLPAAVPAQHLLVPHEDPEGSVTALAESTTNQQRMVVCFEVDAQRWTVVPAGSERLRQAWRGPDQTTWGMTTLALLRAEPGQAELKENEEISARQYFDMATEPSGAFWLATSDGLFRYAPLTWRSPAAVETLNSAVQCLAADTEGRLWFASGGRVFALQDQRLWSYPLPATANRPLQARALFPLKNGVVVLDAEDTETGGGEQLYRLDSGRESFAPLRWEEVGRRPKALGLLKDGSLCVGYSGTGGKAEPGCSLEKYNGRSLEPLPSPPSLGPTLYTLFTAQNGDLWLSGEAGTACCHENKWRAFVAADQTMPAAAINFAELTDGRIWCADSEQVWEFDGRSWSVVRRGFDRINGLAQTRDGSIWVASNGGLHRFFQGAWIENGAEEGIPGTAVRALCEDPRGQLWAGTTRGLSLYHPEADPDRPRTFIEAYPESGNGLPQNATLNLTFNGRDKWKYTPPERLLYSYRLDDHDWSPFQELRQVSLSDLEAGPHYLQVRAMDRNGNIEGPKPAQYNFTVELPWYRETRLMLSSVAGLAIALFFAALAFNRHLQLLRSYAEVEKKVTERTQQLEIASRALLHSQKMNALGALAAGIAHDFNNILSIVKGSAQIIEDNLDHPDKIRIRTDRIKTVVEQGAGIVKAMLGFSRESDQQPALCDVNAVVDDTLKLLGDRFLHEVQVGFQPAAGLPPVLVPKAFVQQILLNFIFNAAEAQSKNKQVVLRTELRRGALEAPPADLVLAPDHTSAFLAISVRDFGCGIPPQNLSRIFDPFFTTKALSSRRGTGLGLSMAYELAKRMGAGLAVASVLNHGSTFTLILPVRQTTTGPDKQP